MQLVSLNVTELKNTPWPDELREILPFYLIKYTGRAEESEEKYIQLSITDDSDVVVDE